MACPCGSSAVNRCSRCKVQKYCSTACQKQHWSQHKTVCDSLKENQLFHSLKQKHKALYESGDSLLDSLLANSAASQCISPTRPTELDLTLSTILQNDSCTYYFAIGEYTSSRLVAPPRRFLVTAGVLTCISVFAWAPNPQSQLGNAVVAHVPISILFDGLHRCRTAPRKDPLQELVLELKRTFHDSPKDSIKVWLIGGFKVMDWPDPGLQSFFPTDQRKWSFAWHVKNSILSASIPPSSLNETLLNVFQGRIVNSNEIEMQVRAENQRFVIAGMDLVTGEIFTHSEGNNRDLSELIPPDVYNSQQRAYGRIVMKPMASTRLYEKSTNK